MNRASEPHAELRVGFIGAGRLGKALAWSLAERGVRVTAVANDTVAGALELAMPIPGCEVLSGQAVADSCDLVFITTPDEAISRATAALTWRPGVAVVHCSGVTEVDALDAAAREGAANSLKSAARDRETGREAARLGMADVAREANNDARDQEAFAAEVLAACDYFTL